MRRVWGMATAAAFTVVLCSGASAQVLTSVPDNAIVFIHVKNLQQTSKKIGGLMQELGIAAMQPALADPLAALEGMGNIKQGLNRAGEAAVVMFNPMTVPQEGQPVVIVLPVSDYAAFIGNFDEAITEDEITEIVMPTDGEPAYIAKWGTYAAVSPNRELVLARPQSTKATGLTGKQLTDRDVVAYINFNGFRSQAIGSMGFGRMMLMGQIDQAPSETPQQAKFKPMVRVAANQLFNGIEHFINETQAITFGADFTPDGVQITTMTEFIPDTYLGKFASQWKSPKMVVGQGLPDGKYAIVGSTALDGDTLTQLIDDMAGPVLLEAQKLGADAMPVIEYVDAIKDSFKAVQVQQFGLTPGKGKPGEDALFDVVAVMQGDSKAAIDAQTRIVTLQQQFVKMVAPDMPQQSAVEIKKAAKAIDGVSFDAVSTTFTDDAANEAIAKIYGKSGSTMLMGSVNPSTAIVMTPRDDAGISSAIAAVKANKSTIADQPQTKQVAAKLPANPIFTFFVYGDQILEIASQASMAFAGSPIDAKLPAGTPPLGSTMSTEGSAVRIDYYIPSPLIKAAVDAAMTAQQPPVAQPMPAEDL